MRFCHLADTHLRKMVPRCRRDDDWMNTQQTQLQFVATIANEHKCPIIITGDIFNNAVVPEEIVNMFIDFTTKVEKGVYFIAGNHDQKFHAMENINESSIGLLISIAESMESPYLRSLRELPVSWAHFGQEIQNPDTDILFLHQLVFKSPADLPPNVDAITAQDLLDEHLSYRWIFVGDMHQSFFYKSKDGRYVINPGHMNRQKVDETSNPQMFYIDTDKEIIESILIPDDAELVTDSYIKAEEARTERIESFVELIKNTGVVSLDFRVNVEQAILENKNVLELSTIDKIHELMTIEGEK